MTNAEIIENILAGREFRVDWINVTYKWRDVRMFCWVNGEWRESLWGLDDFFKHLINGKITLVPEPPKPLSDEMGCALRL